MESKDELKEIDINNHTCYYFDATMRVMDIDFSDILLNEKSYENSLIYDILCNFMGAKLLRIWLEKMDRFIKIFDGIRYLVLFTKGRYNAIYDRINYLKSEKVVLHMALIITFQ